MYIHTYTCKWMKDCILLQIGIWWQPSSELFFGSSWKPLEENIEEQQETHIFRTFWRKHASSKCYQSVPKESDGPQTEGTPERRRCMEKIAVPGLSCSCFPPWTSCRSAVSPAQQVGLCPTAITPLAASYWFQGRICHEQMHFPCTALSVHLVWMLSLTRLAPLLMCTHIYTPPSSALKTQTGCCFSPTASKTPQSICKFTSKPPWFFCGAWGRDDKNKAAFAGLGACNVTVRSALWSGSRSQTSAGLCNQSTHCIYGMDVFIAKIHHLPLCGRG